MANRIPPLTIRNCKVFYKNFSGRPDKYHPRGGDDNRTFCVEIADPEVAQAMTNDGWNVRMPRPSEDGEERYPYIQVKVNYRGDYPPNIYMVSGRRKTLLNADTVGNLDHVRFVNADVRISPYTYIDRDSGEERLSAYVRDLYATVEVDELAEAYADYE